MRELFRKAVLALVLAVAAGVSNAQDGSVPVEVTVPFQLEMELASGFNQYNYTVEERRMLFSAYTAGYDSNSDTLYSGWNTMDEARVRLVPGKKYNMYVDGEEKVEDYQVSFAPLEGYRLFIDGVESYRFTGNGGGGQLSDSVEIYLEANEAPSPAGTAESIEGGDKVFWRVSMGSLKNGRSAGHIQIRQDGFNSTVFTPAALLYENLSDDVHIITSGSDLRQVKTPKALADIVTLSSTSYEIEFYEAWQATYSGSQYTTGSYSPYVKYKVEKYLGSSSKIKITKTIGSKSWQTRLEKSGNVWTLFDWYEGSSHLRKKTWTVDGSGHQTIEVRNGSNGLVSRSREEYSSDGLTKEIYGYGYQNLNTTYVYYTSGSNDGKLKSVTRPDGSWVQYEYYSDIDRKGLVYKTFEPYENSPSTASSSTTGKVTYHYYEPDWTGMKLLPDLVETKVGTHTTSKTTYDYSYPTVTAHGKTLTLTQVTRRDYSSASNYVQTITKSFRQDTDQTDGFFPGKKHSIINPDGTKVSYAYLNGFINPTYMTFTPSASGSERIELVYSGTTNSSAGDLFHEVGITGHKYDVDDLYLVPYVSKRNEIVRGSTGEISWQSEWLYVGGSTGFVLLNGKYSTHDPLGNVERVTRYTKANTSTLIDSLIEYDAQYTNGLLSWEEDELGARTVYNTYDAMGRVTKKTRTGYGSILNIETHFTYDAESRIVSTRIGDSYQIESTSAYDYAGRVTKETVNGESGDVDVDYTYPSSRVVRRTYPDGGYIDEEYFYDGRLYRVSGTATVPKYVDYSVNSSTGVETEFVGMNSAKTIGWSKVSVDWLGRPYEERSPTHAGEAIMKYFYDSTTGQLEKKELKNGSGVKLVADTLYEYDSMGRLFREGMDVNGDSSDLLVPASNDRIKEYNSNYYYDSSEGAYFTRLQTKTYPFDNSSSQMTVSDVREQVTHLYSNSGGLTLLGFRKEVDVNGNVVTTSREGNLSTHELVVETNYPDASTLAVAKSTNGFITYAKSKEGVETTSTYDKWGRKTKDAGRDEVETRYFYYSGSNLLEKTYNKYVQTAKYEYDSSGRVEYKESQNSTGAWHKEYTDYTLRGEVYRKWGNAVQPVEFTYDSYGRRTQMKTYRGGSGWDGSSWPGSPGTADLTTWTYDGATNLVTRKTDDKGEYVDFDYNDRGQIDLKTWARGVTIDYKYYEEVNDTHVSNYTGELKEVVYSDSTTDLYYEYFRHGGLREVDDATGTREFSYRSSDLQLNHEELDFTFYGGYSSQNEARVTRTYASTGVVGRLTGVHYGRASWYNQHYSATYGYDSSTGRISSVAAHGQTFNYTYKSKSNLVEWVTHSSYSRYTKWQTWRDLSDITENKWGSTRKARYIYDTDWHEQYIGQTMDGELFTNSSTGFGGGAYGLRTDWEYSMRGEVEFGDTFKRNSSGGVASYLAGRKEEYSFDNAMNRKTHKFGTASTYTYSVNELNQYTALESSVWNPTYDDDGNMTSNGWWNFTYDAENRIKSAQNNASWATFTYKYDYQGRLVSESGPTLVNGLHGQYFDSLNWTNFKASRTDSQVNFSWGTGVPHPSVTADTFIVRWVGYVEAPADGTYTIYTNTDDGVQLYLDGKLIINDWNTHAPTENSASVVLKKGVKIPILMQYFENTGGATAQLKWSGGDSGITKQAIPSANLWSESLSSTEERRFVYDGWNVIAELDGSKSLQETHLWGLDIASSIHDSAGIGGLLMTRDGSSNYFAMYDGMGNVTGMLNSSGSIVAGYEYNAFGELMRAIGSRKDDHKFGYSSKRTDKEKRLVNFGMRQYDTRQGRFINRDPIGEKGGLNLYGFLGNDGLNNREYLGMGIFDFFKGIMKAALGITKMVTKIAIASLVPGGAYLVAAHGVYEGYKEGGVIGGLVGVVQATAVGFQGNNIWKEMASNTLKKTRAEFAAQIIGGVITREIVKAAERRIRGFGKWFGIASMYSHASGFVRSVGKYATVLVKSVQDSARNLRESIFRSQQIPELDELAFLHNAGAENNERFFDGDVKDIEILRVEAIFEGQTDSEYLQSQGIAASVISGIMVVGSAPLPGSSVGKSVAKQSTKLARAIGDAVVDSEQMILTEVYDPNLVDGIAGTLGLVQHVFRLRRTRRLMANKEIRVTFQWQEYVERRFWFDGWKTRKGHINFDTGSRGIPNNNDVIRAAEKFFLD